MTKYWVSLQKFAGMEIEADSEEEAEEIASNADESELIFAFHFGFEQNEWVVTSVEEIEED